MEDEVATNGDLVDWIVVDDDSNVVLGPNVEGDWRIETELTDDTEVTGTWVVVGVVETEVDGVEVETMRVGGTEFPKNSKVAVVPDSIIGASGQLVSTADFSGGVQRGSDWWNSTIRSDLHGHCRGKNSTWYKMAGAASWLISRIVVKKVSIPPLE